MNKSAGSTSESETSESDNAYSIFLHIVEAIGLILPKSHGNHEFGPRNNVILTASLNSVKFEVEGHSTETSTIFNSNCIWECELGDVKRMKADNRPVKLECFVKNPQMNSSYCPVGTLLLPIRGLQTFSSMRLLQLKLNWHKLSGLRSEWRQSKPEIYLCLAIVKKTLIDSGQFEEFLGKKKHGPTDLFSPILPETALMLQSQSNVYVQLLEQVGLIQVGNNPDVDCDIYNVSLTFKQVREIARLLEREQCGGDNNIQMMKFVFQYDFLGSTSHTEIVRNPNDYYPVNEKISLSFKTSLNSLRLYFQRIFYIPMNLLYNGMAIANYRFNFSKYLPDESFFNGDHTWTYNGTFVFDCLNKQLSPQYSRPAVDFIFQMHLMKSYSKKNNLEIVSFNESFAAYKCNATQDNYIQQNNYVQIDAMKEHIIQYDDVRVSLLNNRLPKYKDEQEQTSADNTPRNKMDDKPDVLMVDVCIGPSVGSLSQKSVGTDVVNLTESNGPCEENKKHETDMDDLTLKVVQELEEWKEQQMNYFLEQLELKEKNYLADLDKEWIQHRNVLQARLEAKIAKCEQLEAELERANAEIVANAKCAVAAEENAFKEQANIGEKVKREIELNYARKFDALEMKMKHLQMEMEQKSSVFEIKTKEVQFENSKLHKEKDDMKNRLDILQNELQIIEKTNISGNQFKEILNDLRQSNERFNEMKKSKNYYKSEWAKTVKQFNMLKLKAMKYTDDKNMHDKIDSNEQLELCLEEILSEEHQALESDRSELKTIKELLLESSDNSSPCDLDDK